MGLQAKQLPLHHPTTPVEIYRLSHFLVSSHKLTVVKTQSLIFLSSDPYRVAWLLGRLPEAQGTCGINA